MKTDKYRKYDIRSIFNILWAALIVAVLSSMMYSMWHYNHRTLDEIKECGNAQLDYVMEVKTQEVFKKYDINRENNENKFAASLLNDCTLGEIWYTSELLKD